MAGQNPGDCEYGSFWHAGANNPADFEFGYSAHIGIPPLEERIFTKVTGVWEAVHTVWHKTGGVWGKSKVYVKVAGAWIEIYDGM